MKLSEHLQAQSLSHGDFAKLVGVSRAFVTQVVNETRRPSYENAKLFSEATGGQVSIDALMQPDKKEDAA